MSRARQEKHSEQIRSRILDIARRIIAEEGAEALSVRRITTEMDYSAGIIYHYFKNKDEILLCVLQEGYQKILNSIRPSSPDIAPDETIRLSVRGYFDAVLKQPFEYKAVMLDPTPQIVMFTSMLGDSPARPALDALVSTLDAGISGGLFAPCDTLVTAQAIWSAIFGLLIRIIIERNVTPERREELIERQIELILKGLTP